MDLQVLKTELDTDPLTRGYAAELAGPDPYQTVANDMNTAYRTRFKDTTPAYEMIEAVDLGEVGQADPETSPATAGGSAPFTDGELQRWNQLTAAGTVVTRSGSNTFASLAALFPNATRPNSRAALIAMASESISRAVELVGSGVTAADIQAAEALP